MDPHRVDLVIQFALLAAGREDDWLERELGPIHLVKYVYLADLAFAARNSGETFTGADWTFYHFGPWAQEVHARIAPAVADIDAIETTFESKYGDSDVKRWRKTDDGLFDRIEKALPLHVGLAVRKSVRQFGRQTSELLHFVYATPPMLRAAPGDKLIFEAEPIAESAPTSPSAPPSKRKAEKKHEARVLEVRARVNELLAQKAKVKADRTLAIAPRYDDVFREGVEWLDTLAGPSLEPKGEIRVDDSVWKAPGRTERRG